MLCRDRVFGNESCTRNLVVDREWRMRLRLPDTAELDGASCRDRREDHQVSLFAVGRLDPVERASDGFSKPRQIGLIAQNGGAEHRGSDFPNRHIVPDRRMYAIIAHFCRNREFQSYRLATLGAFDRFE